MLKKEGIFIDGANIKQLRPRDIRTQFGVVNQSTYLFSGSIRDNISFGLDSVLEEEIFEAARISTSDEFINFLPNGFDYQISEGGKKNCLVDSDRQSAWQGQLSENHL